MGWCLSLYLSVEWRDIQLSEVRQCVGYGAPVLVFALVLLHKWYCWCVSHLVNQSTVPYFPFIFIHLFLPFIFFLLFLIFPLSLFVSDLFTTKHEQAMRAKGILGGGKGKDTGWQLSAECTVVDAIVNTIGFPLVGKERRPCNLPIWILQIIFRMSHILFQSKFWFPIIIILTATSITS